ncbi:unnamed protein product, partial [Polarella glacialis]
VEHHVILNILNRHPVERANFLKLVEEHVDKLAAPRIIYHQLLSGFSQQFRTLIGVNCERKLYFPGEVIVRETMTGDKMYIVNLGSAMVEVAGQDVMQIRGGSYFGYNMITSTAQKLHEKYTETVLAETMCQVLIVSRATYQHALIKYPDMQSVAKVLEAEDRIRSKKQQQSFQQLVRRRRGLRCIIEALHNGALSAGSSNKVNAANRPMLDAFFQGWRNQTLRTAVVKREEEELRVSNAFKIDHWLERRKEQMANVTEQRELRRKLDSRGSRGNLRKVKMPKHPKPPETCVDMSKTCGHIPRIMGSTGKFPALGK